MADARQAHVLNTKLILLTAAAVLAIQIELLFTKSINWDELFHFSQIHAHSRGEYVQWLQTPYVRMFGWVTKLPGTYIDHILLVRLLMVPFGVLTGAIIFDLVRRFTDRESAAIAALATMGSGYVFEHSFALRADMIAAALAMAALWILATRPIRPLWMLAALLLCGMAFVATIKSVLYAPAFIAILGWRSAKGLQPKPVLAAGAIVSLMVAAILLLLPAQITGPVILLIRSSAGRMFGAGLFPHPGYLAVQLAMAPLVTAAILFAVVRIRHGRGQSGRAVHMHWALALGLMLPLAWVMIYRNSFAYFYAFIMPPVAIGAAMGFMGLKQRFGLHPVLLVILANAALISWTEDREVIGRQRDVAEGIDRIFGGPARYIDDIAFRPDYPRAVPQFASGWALEGYRTAGTPIYRQAIEKSPVPFLLRQGYALENITPDAADEMALLPEDAAALDSNYIRHWGQVYVAGRKFAPFAEEQIMEVLAPGPYTVEAGPLTVDGQAYSAGGTLFLERRAYRIGAVGSQGSRLRWGNKLPRPDRPFPAGPLFTNY